MSMVTNTGQTYGKEVAAGVLTSFFWGVICITYDYFNGNKWLFPWLSGFSLASLLTAALMGTLLMIVLAIVVLSPNDVKVPEQRLH